MPNRFPKMSGVQGLEDEWNEVDNNRYASYINLPAGQYQLQIKSTNSDGVWTDNIRTLSIHVLPTFWEISVKKRSLTFASCCSMSTWWRRR